MTKKKLLVVCNILSIIPGVILVPLTPFTFILIYGEGTVPGVWHENLLRILMLLYPFMLLGCLFLSVRLYRKKYQSQGLLVSLIPLFHAVLIAVVFQFGGIQIR